MQRRQWRKIGNNWTKYRHGSWRKSETRKKWLKQQGIRAEKFILRHWRISVILTLSIRNPKAVSYSEVTLWKIIRIIRSIHWTRIVSVSNDSRNSHGHYLKAYRMFRTSNRRSLRLHSGQDGRRTNVIWKNPKAECPDIWTSLPKHKWPKSWSSMEDPVVPLERNLYGHPLAGLLWERPLWESSIEIWLGNGSELGMLVR